MAATKKRRVLAPVEAASKAPVPQKGTVEYRLKHILEHECSMKVLPPDFQPDPSGDSINYRLNFQTGLTNEDKQIVVRIDLDCVLKKDEYHFFNLQVSFYFDYTNKSKVPLRELLEHDQRFKAHVVSLAYSTLRGIVFEKGRGTILNFELLPTVPLQALVQGIS